MILILTEPDDAHADRVEQKLRARGVEVVRFDPARFPSEAEVSLAFTAAGVPAYTLRVDGQSTDLQRVTAVWDRRRRLAVAPSESGDRASRAYVSQECKTFLQNVWSCLDCRWVPAVRSDMLRAQLKAPQLKLAAALGFELPPTLVTNNPEDVLDFYRQHNGDLISKVIGSPAISRDGESFGRFTEPVSKRDVGYTRAVRSCPIIFQARVPKRVELRITVVGRQVFAAEIHSQESNRTRLDWRHYDHFQTGHLAHRLPPDLEQRCVQLVDRLGLCFGAIDLALAPDGRYVFFEVNPNGQYLWIELATGLPISDAICDLLTSGASGPAPAASTLREPVASRR
jgi:hypothetical protein